MSALRKRAATPTREGTSKTKRTTGDDTDSVEVLCRLTPYSGASPCLVVSDENAIKCIPPPNARKRDANVERTFEFGYVFDETDSQKSVFDRSTKDLIEALITGKNGLLFTYGVTGSGKTYTMTGKPTSSGSGILPRTLDVIFNSIDNQVSKCVFFSNGRNGYGVRSKLEAHVARKQLEIDQLQISTEVENRYMEKTTVQGYVDDYLCSVFVSYVEIYNNYCYDLLEKDDGLVKKDVKMDSNMQVFVDGATEVEVESSDEALEVFCRGEERRRTADTLLNKESSRSHSVFTIRLVMAPFKDHGDAYPEEDPRKIVVSQLSLVDLAGSERAKRTFNAGERLAEAGSINKSLLVLRQCIDKLRRNQRSRAQETIPYRESKLTHLFKNYFEGSGKVRMIICANPKPDDFEENINVLCFAEESQAVRVTRAVDRLEQDENRPPVPRRFYQRWNMEIDSATRLDNLVSTPLVPPSFVVLSSDDSETISNLQSFYERRQASSQDDHDDLEAILAEFEPALRSVLCVSDYQKAELDQIKSQRDQDSVWMSQISAENKQQKREIASLRSRLQQYEEHDEELLHAEQALRRSRKDDMDRIRKQEQTLKAIHDICESPVVASSTTPTVAQLRSRFASVEEKRKLMASSSTQLSSVTPSTSDPRRNPNRENQATPGGQGYFNPKFHRRSKSAPRVLDHQPLHRVPTGSILKPRLPPNSKHVTKPEVHHLQKSSEYVLTHQEVDDEGNISTSMFKGRSLNRYAPSRHQHSLVSSGEFTPLFSLPQSDTFSESPSLDRLGDCIPTAGGGTAVLFNDVERVTHESPSRRSRTRASSRR